MINLTTYSEKFESKKTWFCGCDYNDGASYFTYTSGHEEIENKELFQTVYLCTIHKKYMIEKWKQIKSDISED